jgi:hypothetical protein
MKKLSDKNRTEVVGGAVTPATLVKVDAYCKKLNMTRSTFIATCVTIAVEDDMVLDVVANVIVPTIKGVQQALKICKISQAQAAL